MLKDVLFSAVASGIKPAQNSPSNTNPSDTKKLDLAVIVLPKGSQTAAVFTRNIFCAAPVVVAKDHLKNSVRALVINSGNANAGTGVGSGGTGLKNTLEVCELLASELNINRGQILPFSTGVIGQPLPMDAFRSYMPQLVDNLAMQQLHQVARAIMTTDTREKIATQTLSFKGKTVNIIGIAKGSGMIRPNMATMLGFIISDIKASQTQLQHCLTTAVNQSFNRITVDGDTSTNDACTLSATASSGVHISDIEKEFQQALNALSLELAQMIIKDGEGATKFVEVCVKGGKTNADCLEVAYTIAHSPLVKTALFASDANWGRILAVVGRANIHNLKPSDVFIYLNNLCVINSGELSLNYTEQLGSIEMAKKAITITITIGHMATQERVWTTDLSHDYIKINAEYRS